MNVIPKMKDHILFVFRSGKLIYFDDCNHFRHQTGGFVLALRPET